MATLGRTVVVRGELRSTEDLVIEGRIEGDVLSEGAAVTVAASGAIRGDVIARDITIYGRSDGQLVATDVVDIRAAADVTGRVISARLILADGAVFRGHVEPQHLEAALRVSRFNRQKPAQPAPRAL